MSSSGDEVEFGNGNQQAVVQTRPGFAEAGRKPTLSTSCDASTPISYSNQTAKNSQAEHGAESSKNLPPDIRGKDFLLNPDSNISRKRTCDETCETYSSFSEKVAKHYDSFQERTGESTNSDRKKSKVFKLRIFNNWVKRVIILKTFEQLARRVEKGELASRRINILDLACGKGGDINKWVVAAEEHKLIINRIVFVDISPKSIEECKRRMQQTQAELFRVSTFIVMDCGDEKLQDKFPPNEELFFHVSSCQFAIHYGFETKARANRLLENLTSYLIHQGFCIGTYPNGTELLRRANEGEIKNSVYNVTFDFDITNPNDFGSKYHFQLDSVVDCPEFLLQQNVLQRLMKEKMCLPVRKLNCSFGEFYRNIASPSNLQLLERRDKFYMHDDEWEVVRAYNLFVFQNVNERSRGNLMLIARFERLKREEEEEKRLSEKGKEQYMKSARASLKSKLGFTFPGQNHED